MLQSLPPTDRPFRQKNITSHPTHRSQAADNFQRSQSSNTRAFWPDYLAEPLVSPVQIVLSISLGTTSQRNAWSSSWFRCNLALPPLLSERILTTSHSSVTPPNKSSRLVFAMRCFLLCFGWTPQARTEQPEQTIQLPISRLPADQNLILCFPSYESRKQQCTVTLLFGLPS